MKKGIVIGLAIAVVFMFVSCGDKPNGDNDKIVKESLEQQLMGPTWYQTLTTETDLGAGYLSENSSNYCDEITLKITTTVTYTFNSDTFSSTSEITQKKSGWTRGFYGIDGEGNYIEIPGEEVSETTTETESVTGSWYFEDDRLYMIEDNAVTGTSFSVSIINDELILENEYAGTFTRLKKK